MTDAGDTSPTSGLLRSSSVMAAGTVFSRALGFVRSAVLAAAIGTQLVATTFNVANTVPNIIYILLAGGVLNAVFVPQLVRAMADRDGGQAYTDRLLTLAGLVLLVITVLATAAAPLIIRLYTPGSWSGSDVATATVFAFWCLPQIAFYGAYTMLGQVLNARGSFGPMMWAPILNNLVAIVTGLVFIAFVTVDFENPGALGAGAIALLGAGTTAGVLVQALVLVPVLRRTGFRYRPRFDFRGTGLGKARELAKWSLMFVFVNQIAYAVVVNLGARVDKAAAETIAYGVGYTAYTYAYLIFILPHSIITVSVVTALLPRMSAAAAARDHATLRADLSTGWRLTAVGVVVAAAGYVALGPDLTGLLYAGAGDDGARYIGLVLAAFGVGLPAFSAQYLALRGFYALEDTRTPFLLQVGIASTNVLLALAAYVVLPLRWKIVGVALSYSLTYLVGLAVSSYVLRRRIGGLDGSRVFRTYARLVAAAVPAAAAAYGVAHLVTSHVGEGARGSLVALALGGLVLVGGYLGLARLLHVEELTALVGMVRGRSLG
ncbi:MAG: putative peptidoglycan lipid flippase [Actinomycetota bacterium]|nr:putative peptidoglycan lipid flippase [Actinomycetota bacterium]